MLAYRDDIDGLRCLAVMLVVLFHVQLPFISGGYLGVDVFFVISGFLVTSVITNSMERGTFRFSNFYARRIRRLFPAVFVTVVASLVAGWFLFPPDAYSDLAQSSIATLLSGSNIYFWATSGYFETAAHYKPLLHTWSLAVEEQFYLVWPLSILLIAGRTPNRRRLAVALAVAVVLSTGLAEWTIRRDAMSAAFFLLPFRINEFAIGALIAFLPALKPRFANEGLALAGLAGVLVPSFLYTPETVFPGLSAMVPCVATAALIYAGPQTVLAKLFSLRPLTYVGRISYSVYLAHWPIIAFFLFWRGSAVGLSPLEQAVLVAASLALGALLYHLVETPFRVVRGEAKIGSKVSNEGVGMWFAGSSLVAVVASAIVWGNQGLKDRYDASADTNRLLSSMTENPMSTLSSELAKADLSNYIILIGDSHAGPLEPAITSWGLKNDTRITMHGLGACMPLPGTVTAGPTTNKQDLCQRMNRDYYDVQLDAGVDVVVMAAAWGLYTAKSTQRRQSRLNKLAMPILFDKTERIEPSLALEESRSRFKTRLEEAFKRFTDNGASVIFVGQVPHTGDNTEPCVARMRTARDVERECHSISKDEILQETQWSIEAAREVAARFPDVVVFDPTPSFCKGDRCQLTAEGKMLYRDDNHLSSHGGFHLFRDLEPIVESLMAQQKGRPVGRPR